MPLPLLLIADLARRGQIEIEIEVEVGEHSSRDCLDSSDIILYYSIVYSILYSVILFASSLELLYRSVILLFP